jgi:hypothetical protein
MDAYRAKNRGDRQKCRQVNELVSSKVFQHAIKPEEPKESDKAQNAQIYSCNLVVYVGRARAAASRASRTSACQ